MSVKCPWVNFSDPWLGSVPSTVSWIFCLLHHCLFFFWKHLHQQGALGVTKSTPLLSAISDFSFILCSNLEIGPGEDIQHKDFLKFQKQEFCLYLGKSQGCRHEGTSLSSMMPFPGHWGKGVGGVRGDGVTGTFRQGYFSTSFCHIAWDYVNLKTAFSPEFVMPMAASPCSWSKGDLFPSRPSQIPNPIASWYIS